MSVSQYKEWQLPMKFSYSLKPNRDILPSKLFSEELSCSCLKLTSHDHPPEVPMSFS